MTRLNVFYSPLNCFIKFLNNLIIGIHTPYQTGNGSLELCLEYVQALIILVLIKIHLGILGFILGPLAETNLRRALMVSKGAFLPLISNTPSIILISLSVLSLILAPRLLKREAKAQAEQEALETSNSAE